MIPNITLTESAQDMFRAALAEEGDDAAIRLAVQKLNPVNLHYELEIVSAGPATEGDVEVTTSSVRIFVDPDSVELIDGATIDYLSGERGAGFKFVNPNDLRHKKWEDPVAQRFQKLLEDEINPGIAAHGGFITLVNYKDGIASIYMGGGCQGCGQADATLQQGVEARVKEVIPEIIDIVDATDHASGENPFY